MLKGVKRLARNVQLIKVQYKSLKDLIKSRAEAMLNPEIMALQDVDLVTKEDKCHLSCYIDFIPWKALSSKPNTNKAMHLAHKHAFMYIYECAEELITHGE